MKITVLRLLFLLALALGVSTAFSQRLALVIGNAAYEGQTVLRNPGNDASDVAAKLSRMSFNGGQVRPQINLKRKGINDALRDFVNQASNADLALVYYSGHGMQTGGETYLIPTDAQISSEYDITSEGLPLSRIMGELQARGVRRTVIILDACRDNPYSTGKKGGPKGLAPPREMSSAYLVAYATADGKTADDGKGRNGTYTAELLKILDQPGKNLRDVMEDTQLAVESASLGKQVPKIYGDTARFRDVYLLASVRAGLIPNTPQPEQAGSMSLEDLEKEEATRKQWAQWQGRMKADFDRTSAFTGSADLQAKAWERYLGAWGQDNPLSKEDDELRAHAQNRREQASRATLASANVESAVATWTYQVPSAYETMPKPKVSYAGTSYFDHLGLAIKGQAQSALEMSERARSIKLEVLIAVGHAAANEGSPGATQALSVRRAEAVKAYLVSQGMEPNRIYTEGKGANQPVASNGTPEGREKNRRVEMEIVGTAR